MIDSRELLFWIPTHNDTHRLANALSSIRTFSPRASAVVYRDRDPLAELSGKVAEHFGAELVSYNGDSHYESWPRSRDLHRTWLEWFLERTGGMWFLKFDTDSLMLRPFTNLPRDGVFGRMARCAWGVFPQGGCYGMDRTTAGRILALPPPSLDEVLARGDIRRGGRFCEDRYLGWLARRAGVALLRCPQIASFGKKVPKKRLQTAAVIHPTRDFCTGRRLLAEISS